MKGKIFAIICLLFFTSYPTLNAQWARTYGTEEDEHAYFVKQTADGGYIVAGQSGEYLFEDGHSVPPGQDIWIIKLSPDGEIEWQKAYGENGTDEVHFIQQTNDGGYIFGGRLWAYGGLSYFSIIKLSPNGDIDWQKNYGDDAVNNVALSLQQTIDGGYIVAGHDFYSNTQTYDILILKLFSDGTVEWNKTYRGSLDDLPHSIQQTVDGGYIVAGRTNSFGTGEYDIWILKIASDGMIEWQKTYGESQNEMVYSIHQTLDDGFIVAGSINSFGAGSSDYWIIKLNPLGDIEWQKTYGGSLMDVAYSIQQTVDGGYVVAGETSSFGAGNGDFWILKLNTLGNIEWQKTYGGSQREEVSFIQQTCDGTYIVAGSTDSYGVRKRDFLVLKVFSNGAVNPACRFISDSNVEVFDTNITPRDTFVAPEYPNVQFVDIYTIPRETDAVVYSLCSGQHTLSITASSGGTTDPGPGTYSYDHAERISLIAKPDEGYIFIGWSGDVFGTDSSQYITMDSDKSVKANFSENILEDIWEEAKKAPCFIATTAFGSPYHPFVIALQDFRDKYLLSSRAGRKLVNLYYKYSPHIAEIITNHTVLKTVVRIWLIPFVAFGYSMVHFGPSITAIMLILSTMPLFFFVWFYRRKNKQSEN